MKKVLILLAIVVAAIGANAAYQKHQRSEEVKAMTALIRDASGKVATQLSHFNGKSGISMKDAIAEADQNVIYFDGAIAKSSVGDAPRDPVIVTHTQQYLKLAQESMRRTRYLITAKAEATLSYEALTELVAKYQDFVAAPQDSAAVFHKDVADYSQEGTKRRADKAMARLNETSEALGATLSQMIALRNAKPSIVPIDAYLTDGQVTNIKVSVP